MRIDKLAMTSREALQTAMSTAADAQAGAVEPIHLLSVPPGSRARRRSPRGAGSRPRSTRAARPRRGAASTSVQRPRAPRARGGRLARARVLARPEAPRAWAGGRPGGAPPSPDTGSDPGARRARGRWEATRVLFLGCGDTATPVDRLRIRREAPSRSNEMRSREGHARILECRTCVEKTRPPAARSPGEDR